MADGPPMTDRTLRLLREMLAAPDGAWTAAEVCHATGLASGTVSPLMARLAGYRWLESMPGVGAARPYRFTEHGLAAARAAVDGGPASPVPQPRVWTLNELAEAVERGEQPRVLLEAAAEALGERVPRVRQGARTATGG